jgi:multiple sugar transport system substrate-binding protein
MNLTKTQIIIIAAVGFVILLLLLIFFGLLPGLRKEDPALKLKATLEFWGVFDSVAAYDGAIKKFNETYPGVTVNYRSFSSISDYETALLDALAAGKGPDIFMVRNRALPRDINKITPAPASQVSLLGLRNLFPQVVETDFVSRGVIYALPLSIDTLALFSNQDFLNQAAITNPPANWEDFEKAIPSLLRKDSEGKLTRSAAAIGGSLRSMEQGPDLLSLLMLQSGTKMASDDFSRATFASPQGEEALKFYTKFADPKSTLYTWSDSFGKSLDVFAEEKAAIIFDYHSAVSRIRAKNAFLNFTISAIPQPVRAEKSIAYPNYFGYAVSRQSRRGNLAWEFVIKLTSDKEVAKSYFQVTKKPPALRSLIEENLNNPELSVFARQALIARSFPQTEPNVFSQIFSGMIESVLSGTLPGAALKKAEEEATQLMQRRL